MMLSPAPEMTTAVTDGLFGILAFFFAYKLGGKTNDVRTKLWRYVLAGTGASAVLGVPAHALYAIAGANPPNLAAQTMYWAFLGFFLFFMATMLGIAVLNDISGGKYLKKISVIIGCAGIVFYALYFAVAVMQIIAGYFIVFIGYSALIMIFALISYIVLYIRRKDAGYLFIAAAVLVAVIANVLQASRSIFFTVIWAFDYNSVYHFVMMISMYLFYRGVKKPA